MLEEAKKDPRQYASLKLAARRMAAGKDLVSKSHITIEGDDPMGSAKPEEAPAEEAPSEE